LRLSPEQTAIHRPGWWAYWSNSIQKRISFKDTEMPETKTPEQKKVTQRSVGLRFAERTAADILRCALFYGRGFSRRTANALFTRGIDAPERLLFASEAELKKIPGIGKVSLDEIMRYRARYIRDENQLFT
jgi:DNA-directed RNA polymerase alpha subunit